MIVPGLEAQVNMVCDNSKLVGTLLEKEVNVLLVEMRAEQRKVLSPSGAIKRVLIIMIQHRLGKM